MIVARSPRTCEPGQLQDEAIELLVERGEVVIESVLQEHGLPRGGRVAGSGWRLGRALRLAARRGVENDAIEPLADRHAGALRGREGALAGLRPDALNLPRNAGFHARNHVLKQGAGAARTPRWN